MHLHGADEGCRFTRGVRTDEDVVSVFNAHPLTVCVLVSRLSCEDEDVVSVFNAHPLSVCLYVLVS